MRSFIVMAMFVASLTHAAMNDFTEARYLALDTDDIEVLSIDAGAGSINVRGVRGSVTIDDGSGSIRVGDVEEDLIITDDGSGSLTYSDIRGTVEQDT